MTPTELAIEALERARDAFDAIYNHGASPRAAVIESYGTLHSVTDAALAALRGQAAPPPSADLALLEQAMQALVNLKAGSSAVWTTRADGSYDTEADGAIAAIRARLGQGEK